MPESPEVEVTSPLIPPEDDTAICALLADLPDLEMPEDVAARIATALADETPLSGAAPAWAVGGSDNVSVLPSRQERDQRRSRRNTRVLSAAAVVALIVGTVAVGASLFEADQPAANLTADAAGSGSETADSTRPRAVPATLLTTSGATYSKDELTTQVAGLVSAAEAPGAPLTVTEPAAAPTPGPDAPTSFAASDVVTEAYARLTCVAKLVETAGQQPIAIDAGAWRGSTEAATPPRSTPAAVVVLPGDDATRVAVYVVQPSCADPNDLDAHLLYFAFVPHP